MRAVDAEEVELLNWGRSPVRWRRRGQHIYSMSRHKCHGHGICSHLWKARRWPRASTEGHRKLWASGGLGIHVAGLARYERL